MMLSCGFAFDTLRRLPADPHTGEAVPDFGQPTVFVPQRVVAVRRAAWIIAVTLGALLMYGFARIVKI